MITGWFHCCYNLHCPLILVLSQLEHQSLLMQNYFQILIVDILLVQSSQSNCHHTLYPTLHSCISLLYRNMDCFHPPTLLGVLPSNIKFNNILHNLCATLFVNINSMYQPKVCFVTLYRLNDLTFNKYSFYTAEKQICDRVYENQSYLHIKFD